MMLGNLQNPQMNKLIQKIMVLSISHLEMLNGNKQNVNIVFY